VARYLKNPTTDQVVDGLTEFYEDFRNRSIRVNEAIWVVLRQIAGDPSDQIKQLIANLRKSAAAS